MICTFQVIYPLHVVCIVSKVGRIVTTRQGKDKEFTNNNKMESVNKSETCNDRMDSMDKSETNLDEVWESVAKSFFQKSQICQSMLYHDLCHMLLTNVIDGCH